MRLDAGRDDRAPRGSRRCFRVELGLSGRAPCAAPVVTEVCADETDLARAE